MEDSNLDKLFEMVFTVLKEEQAERKKLEARISETERENRQLCEMLAPLRGGAGVSEELLRMKKDLDSHLSEQMTEQLANEQLREQTGKLAGESGRLREDISSLQEELDLMKLEYGRISEAMKQYIAEEKLFADMVMEHDVRLGEISRNSEQIRNSVKGLEALVTVTTEQLFTRVKDDLKKISTRLDDLLADVLLLEEEVRRNRK